MKDLRDLEDVPSTRAGGRADLGLSHSATRDTCPVRCRVNGQEGGADDQRSETVSA